MLAPFFSAYPEFEIQTRPTAELLGKYQDQLPAEVLYFWEAYGFGAFLNGYLKLVNPEDWQSFLRESYDIFSEPAIVIGLTSMADLLIWEENAFVLLNYRMGKHQVVGRKAKLFFNRILTDWNYSAGRMQATQYLAAVERYGVPAFDECFAYVPALALGGSEDPGKMQRVKIREHLAILSSLVGKIGG